MEPVSSQTYTASWDAGGNPVAYQEPWGHSGAFTTLRLDVLRAGRCPYLFEKHMDRLFGTFADMGWATLFKRAWLEQCVKDFIKTVTEEGTYLLRIMMSDVIVSMRAAPRAEPLHMQRGLLWDYTRPTPAYKTLDYTDVLDALGGIDRAREELLIVSEDGRIVEGATTGLLFIGEGKIICPERDRLKSITLELVSDKLKQQPFVVDDVYTDELGRFEEILICGSGKGVINLGEIPELEWQCRSTTGFRRVRLTHDNAMIDYKYTWL